MKDLLILPGSWKKKKKRKKDELRVHNIAYEPVCSELVGLCQRLAWLQGTDERTGFFMASHAVELQKE